MSSFAQHQKLVSWGLLVLALLVALFFGALPWWSFNNDLSDKIDSGYRQLSKYRQVANATPEFMAEYERVKQQGLDKLFYPDTMTRAQVAIELQKTVATAVSNGGMLLSSEVLERDAQAAETSKASGYQAVTVKAVFTASPALLRDVLHQIYQSRPLAFVESIDIKPQSTEGETNQSVKVEMRIATYWRGQEEVTDETVP